jgi:hypothetical protein
MINNYDNNNNNSLIKLIAILIKKTDNNNNHNQLCKGGGFLATINAMIFLRQYLCFQQEKIILNSINIRVIFCAFV